jgi:hypothetical protein
MPYNKPRGSEADSGSGLAANHSVAVLVLVALVALFALRHVFGTVAVSAGTS